MPTPSIPGTLARSFLTPLETVGVISDGMLKRIANPWYVIFLLSLMGGIFTALGASVYLYILADPALGQYHISRLLASLFFSSGLIMIVFTGSELLTGAVLAIMLAVQRRMPWTAFLRYLLIIALGNFSGILLTIAIMHAGGLFEASQYLWHTAHDIGVYKAALPFSKAFFLAILCNICVCMGIWSAHASLSSTGKIMAIIFPITLFVTVGFEHIVANMFFLSVSLIYQDSLTFMSAFSFLLGNFIPVFLGNMVGGVALALIMVVCHRTNGYAFERTHGNQPHS